MEGLPPTTAQYLREEIETAAAAPDLPDLTSPSPSASSARGGLDYPLSGLQDVRTIGRYSRLDASRLREASRVATDEGDGARQCATLTRPHHSSSGSGDANFRHGDDLAVDDGGGGPILSGTPRTSAAAARTTSTDRTENGGMFDLVRPHPRSSSVPAMGMGSSTAPPSTGTMRRIRGKQPPESSQSAAALVEPVPPPPVPSRCQPVASSPWSQRLSLPHGAAFGKCSICSTRSRTFCKGCLQPLCIRCARERLWCRVRPGESS